MTSKQPELTLDPENWDETRKLGHQIVDDLIDMLRSDRERLCWQPITEKTKQGFREPAPRKPSDPQQVYEELKEIIDLKKRPLSPQSHGMLGWLVGQSTATSIYADMLIAGLNDTAVSNMTEGYYLEKETVNWIKEMIGYPMSGSGLFTSGGSMGNLLCLTIARNSQAGYDVRKHGNFTSPRTTYYCSEEAHSSIQKTLEVLGVGHENIRRVPVNDDYQISVNDLEALIREDRKAGLKPICVIGAAGTTNTAAFDDLIALSKICKEEGLWLHVDAAFGGWVSLSSELRHLVSGIERADSVMLDLHKWISMPNGVGCILVKDEKKHRAAFDLTPEYLRHDESAGVWLDAYGFELTRNLRALKAWMSFKEHGAEKYGMLIEQNVEQARFLGKLIGESAVLRMVAPVSCNIVCFRYYDSRLSGPQLNELNEKLLTALWMEGLFTPSSTMLKGVYAIRAAFINHRVRFSDVESLAADVARIGGKLVKDYV